VGQALLRRPPSLLYNKFLGRLIFKDDGNGFPSISYISFIIPDYLVIEEIPHYFHQCTVSAQKTISCENLHAISVCSAQTVTRIGLLEEIPRSGVQIPCLY
jgi:hypothetical protein